MVILDEGHNIINTIQDIYSPKITKAMVQQSLHQLEAYYQKYSDRLASTSHSYIIHLLFIFKQLIQTLSKEAKTCVFSTDRFLQVLQLENVNLFDLTHFIVSKRIVNKLNGFVDRTGTETGSVVSFFPFVLTFITSLTSSKEDSRVIVTTDGTDQSFVQLLFLNPGIHFQEIVQECRSVVIAGGTLQPVIISLYWLCSLRSYNPNCFWIVKSSARLPLCPYRTCCLTVRSAVCFAHKRRMDVLSGSISHSGNPRSSWEIWQRSSYYWVMLSRGEW